MADALSTSVFIMPFEKGLKLINSLPNTEALWVMKNGEVRYSDNFKKYIKK
jgi:thiamine biosynthesis lipoprotein